MFKVIKRFARTYFLNRFYAFLNISIVHLDHVNAGWLFHSRVISIMLQIFQLPVYLFTFTSIAYSHHFQNHTLVFFHLLFSSRFDMSDINFQMFHRIVNDNKTEYYKGINDSIDTSKYLTTKNIFLQEISLLNSSKTYWESVVKNPSEKILGNILFDLERSGKIENLKGATKTTFLSNKYSYHSHCNKVLKLKESRIKKRSSDLTIKEECCSAPRQKFTLSVVRSYDRNKCLICQKQSKETLFKVSCDLRVEQIKNAFRIATHTLSTVKVRFDHALDARAGKQFILYKLKYSCSKSIVKHSKKSLAIFKVNKKDIRTTSFWSLNY